LPAPPDDDAHHVRGLTARRHEVDERGGAIAGRELGLEDQRVVAIAPRDPRLRVDGRDLPASVLGRAEQRGEAGAAVEARPAQPVDRAVAADQRRRLAVANERVILDRGCHGRVYGAAQTMTTVSGSSRVPSNKSPEKKLDGPRFIGSAIIPSAVERFRAVRAASGDTLAVAHWFPLASHAGVRSASCPSAPDLNGQARAVEPMQSVNAASGAVAAPLAVAAALVIRPRVLADSPPAALDRPPQLRHSLTATDRAPSRVTQPPTVRGKRWMPASRFEARRTW